MEPLYDQKYKDLEERGWWFRGRRDMLLRLLKGFDKKSRILDIGCANGVFLNILRRNEFEGLHGIDISERAVDYCRRSGLSNVFLMDGARPDFPNEYFDIIIASDVLEHIREDGRALLEWVRILKKGGTLVIFVPAFTYLWSAHDMINHHWRRYSRSELVSDLGKAQLRITRASYWNCALFFPALILRTLQRFRFSNEDTSRTVAQSYRLNLFANPIFTNLLRIENRILTKINFPFGLSVFAVAKKK